MVSGSKQYLTTYFTITYCSIKLFLKIQVRCLRISNFVLDKPRYLLWDSNPLPFQAQANIEQVFVNPMGVEFPRFSYQSQLIFGTNTGPQYGRNTFEGYEEPSSSSNGTFMMTNRSQQSISNQTIQPSNSIVPGTFEFSQASTDLLHSLQPTIPDEDFPPLHEPPCPNAPPNRTFPNFQQDS